MSMVVVQLIEIVRRILVHIVYNYPGEFIKLLEKKAPQEVN